MIVDNEPGVLARVIGLFSGRGYNIDSLTVSETEHQKHLSRITIVTRGTPMVIEQIKNQLDRLVPIHRVVDMTLAGPAIQRELAMVKVAGTGEQRVEALRLADAFRARVIDAGTESFIFEITGASEKIEQFIALMLPLGLVEVSRTGVVAIARGAGGDVRRCLTCVRLMPYDVAMRIAICRHKVAKRFLDAGDVAGLRGRPRRQLSSSDRCSAGVECRADRETFPDAGSVHPLRAAANCGCGRLV